LHYATATAVQKAEPVPEIMDTRYCLARVDKLGGLKHLNSQKKKSMPLKKSEFLFYRNIFPKNP
jgi:hypothetical protein